MQKAALNDPSYVSKSAFGRRSSAISTAIILSALVSTMGGKGRG